MKKIKVTETYLSHLKNGDKVMIFLNGKFIPFTIKDDYIYRKIQNKKYGEMKMNTNNDIVIVDGINYHVPHLPDLSKSLNC